MRLGRTKGILLTVLITIMVLLQACTKPIDTTKSAATKEAAKGGGTLVVAMTSANVPIPDTYPTEGSEGLRFVGFQIYDGLVKWDLSRDDTPAVPKPGLATSWDISSDKTTWTFHLRKNVKFHDGTDWNADAAIFGLDRVHKKDFPNYSPKMAGGIAQSTKWIASYNKIDDFTIEIKLNQPYGLFNWDMIQVLFASPEAIKKYGNDYFKHPSGTGPYKFVSMEQGQRMVLEPNKEYWDDVPKLDQLILLSIPEASARLAALLSGEVNWAEIPPPDSVNSLKSRGFQVYLNKYPHVWPFTINMNSKPWDNKLVRQAANYAIDREGLSKSLLNGVATPATQVFYEGHSWFNKDAVKYDYNPEKAKQLLAQAGYPNGFETNFVIPSSGSGNMWPQTMTEFVQKNLQNVGIKVKVEVVEWQTLLDMAMGGFANKDYGAFMFSLSTHSFSQGLERFFSVKSFPPVGVNRGKYSNPKVEALIDQIKVADPSQLDGLMREVQGIIAEDAPWIFVVHDLNLRVLAPNVKGFKMAQSWFQDLSHITVNGK
jgi:peptide/nickel transport system substrate-binding protein